MDDRAEYKGHWWMPELPEVKVSGTLSVMRGKRANLELQGNLREDHFWENEIIANTPLILGLSINGEHFTLYDCMPTEVVSHFPGIPTSAFSVNKTFIGAHFSTVDEIRFKSVSARYMNLEEWINFRSLDIKENVEKDEILIKFNLPKPITTKLGDYELVIRIDKRIGDWWNKVNIILEARIELSSPQNKPLEDYLDRLLLIQHFLSLAISEPTYPLEIQGTSESAKQTVGDGYLYEPVDIYYGVPHLPSEELRVIPHEMLFTLPQIKEQAGDYINNWVNNAELLKPVYDLYFSTLYNQRLYLEGSFLNLAQCIETYHRRRFGGKYQSDEEYRSGLYQRFIETLPQDLDASFRQSLKKGKLWFANEFSLRKRLQEIIDRLSALPISFINTGETRASFISKVCDTRNYLTHYDPQLQDKAAKDIELFELKEKLKILLGICLLEETGFSLESIRDIITTDQRFKRLFRFIVG